MNTVITLDDYAADTDKRALADAVRAALNLSAVVRMEFTDSEVIVTSYDVTDGKYKLNEARNEVLTVTERYPWSGGA